MTTTTIQVHSGEHRDSRPLGLLPLTALVVGSMIGGGVFSLPQNMAKGASPGAVVIGWIISGIGILALALVYRNLAIRKPELDAGPYAYARAGFGDFIGFNSAWGYWLSAWLGNVSYAVLIFGALSYFFPAFGAEGNTWQAVLGASVLLWAIHALILVGVREAAIVNAVTTIAKLAPLFIFVVALLVVFNMPSFTLDFWGTGTPSLGSIVDQVKSTMLVTLWVFIGIEGASVVSGRADTRRHVGAATIFGFLTALAIYVLVSLLSYSAMTQAELAGLPTAASMANVLEKVVGPWGSVLIRIGLVISVVGAFLSWTLFAAEIPYRAAEDGLMPGVFSTENRNGSPSGALWVTNILVQLFLLITLYSNATYLALYYMSATAILVPYVLSGAYAVKSSLENGGDRSTLFFGAIATVYGAWLIYAAGPNYLLMVSLLYAPGILVYISASKAQRRRAFNAVDAGVATALIVLASAAAYLMWAGKISAL
jgi:arginine:ornithine antiporter / lysine permease